VACGEDGIAVFDRIRYKRHDHTVFIWAFDLIELDGDDLRHEPRPAAASKARRGLIRRPGSAAWLR
jgi:hypothetical protein